MKWADYGIERVKYNPEKTHIIQVEAAPDNGESIGSPLVMNRTQVVSFLDQGKTFVTILGNKDGQWNRGADVHKVRINGTFYIRTDNDNTPKDNLGNLPEF